MGYLQDSYPVFGWGEGATQVGGPPPVGDCGRENAEAGRPKEGRGLLRPDRHIQKMAWSGGITDVRSRRLAATAREISGRRR